jgi:hypothetical protein
MSRLSGVTSSRFLIAAALFALFTFANGPACFCAMQGFAQEPTSANGSAVDSSQTTPAATFGALYGAAVGKRDGTMRLVPRPNRSLLYSNTREYRPSYGLRADYEQQYRSAFEKAYRLAYRAALNNAKRRAEQAQTPSGATGSSAR